MADRFIPTRNSFILTSTNVWTKVADWTEWQNVWQTSNCFDLTVSSIEIDDDLIYRFHDAARKGDVSLVESMLQEGVPVDCVDRFDQTALFHAALFNRTDVIRLLLQKGADVNKRDWNGETPVHYAAITNSTEAIAMLIKHGASISITNYEGDTPVHFAALNNSTEVIAMLIKHGASINITNDEGEKPIDCARQFRKKAALRMLEQLSKRFWNVHNSLLFMFYVDFTRLNCSFDWWSEFA